MGGDEEKSHSYSKINSKSLFLYYIFFIFLLFCSRSLHVLTADVISAVNTFEYSEGGTKAL